MAETHTHGTWFGTARASGFGWLTCPDATVSPSGVVILPPVGYPYWTSHRTLRVLAERLGAQGHTVLRVDYAGTGDAPGDQWDDNRLVAWQDTVRDAVAYLRSLGAAELTLVGARLGGSLALMLGGELAVDRVVAWSPVLRGRRYVKEIRLLSVEVPPDDDPLGGGTRALSGSVFSAATLADLASIDLTALVTRPADRVLLIDGAPSAAPVADAWTELGADVSVHIASGSASAFDTPTEFATVPEPIVDHIVGWLGGSRAGTREPRWEHSTLIAWHGGEVRETVVQLAPQGHVALVCEPADGTASAGALVLLNPGSEAHVGPGRAWVELARDMALRGHRTVRADFLGWGESPDAGRAPGRPYDPAGVADANVIAGAVRARFGGPIVLFGLCAAAWIILESVLERQVDGVIALNPQMYWQQGDPVDIDWDRIRARRAEEIAAVARGAEDGLWDRLDAEGDRPRVARWLEAIAATAVPTHLLFAEGDDGLIYLRQRWARQLGRLEAESGLQLTEMAGVDHPLHRVWARPIAFAAIAAAYEQQRRTAEMGGSPHAVSPAG